MTRPEIEALLEGAYFPDAETREAVIARVSAVAAALGAHIIADAYRDTFPDDAADANYLRKSEDLNRQTARSFLTPELENICHQIAKSRFTIPKGPAND